MKGLNRREFLRSGAVAGAVVAVPQIAAAPTPAMARAAGAAPNAATAGVSRDYVSLVDPWVQSDISRWFFFQSASNPFGFVKLRPDTNNSQQFAISGCVPSDPDVKGFSHLHDWQIAGVQVMPTSGPSVPKTQGENGWQSPRVHANEIAQPAYHKVHLDRYGITAELTCTDRVGLHRYTYDNAGPSEIIISLEGVMGEADMLNAQVTQVSNNEIEGYVDQHGSYSPLTYSNRLYFTIRFDKPFDSLHGWVDGSLANGGGPISELAGKNMGVYARYEQLDAGEVIQMNVGLSFTGTQGARNNLETEAPGFDFNGVKTASQQHWNDMLGRINVQGGTSQQQIKFYTDLFHVLCGRSLISDVDGKYLDGTWGIDQVKQIPLDAHGNPKFAMYDHDALWLTQWNLNSMLGLAYPEVYSSFVQCHLQMYQNGGLLARGPVAGNDSLIMTGSPITSFICGAWNKGIRDFDIDLAYQAMLDAHSVGGLFDKAENEYSTWTGGGGVREYMDLGYAPYDMAGTKGVGGAGMTLEYAYQDWTLAQLARQLGKKGLNASQFADVTVSSQFNDTNFAGTRAVDGRPIRSGRTPAGWVEWASAGERTPWIKLTWDTPRTISKVVLSDRADPDYNVNSGVLNFSDGSSIQVSGVPADGTNKVVQFPARAVTWVQFDATGGTMDARENAALWPGVTATASSQYSAANGVAMVHDGFGPGSGEWASAGEQNPWVQLTWDTPIQSDKIVLYDRISYDNANGGTLSFSDGSTIQVTDIPANGDPKAITFGMKTFSWVRFQITDGTGPYPGLLEFEVYVTPSAGDPTQVQPAVGLNEIEVWDDTDNYTYLLGRSRNWRNLFDPATGFIRPRWSDGKWLDPFDPLAGTDFVEANSWQASWFTVHDVMGQANLLGSRSTYAQKLNYAFTLSAPYDFSGSGYGQDFLYYGNQPALEVAQLFNYVGYPWLTQYWTRRVKQQTFDPISTTAGYGLNDEDQGQMGSISALMAMGLFEVTGAGLSRPIYDITSPVFDEITIALNPDYYPGGTFNIITHGNSAANMYIQSATLNGAKLDNAWFHHDQLTVGGTLELWLGDQPNKNWGTAVLPPSESSSNGQQPVNATAISIIGPDTVDPYSYTFTADFSPQDTSLKLVYWSVTEPDGSPTDKATIAPTGRLTPKSTGNVLVTATAADEGGVTGSKTVALSTTVDLGQPIAIVGKPDLSQDEFALAPDQYAKYPTQFPNDVDFTYGTSNPATDWSYIHPGPDDAWADNKAHTFTFRFNLPQAPSGDLTFTAWLIDTQQAVPPTVQIGLNGTVVQTLSLPGGGGDGYHWGGGEPNSYNGIVPSAFDVTLAAAQLRAGQNVVTITNTSGSWLVYDAFGVRQKSST